MWPLMWGMACAGAPAETITPAVSGTDAERQHVQVSLVPVASDLGRVVDIQFPPGRSDVMAVVDQAGVARWVGIDGKAQGELLRVDVDTGGEKGLLGLAFHPGFAENGRLFVNATIKQDGKLVSRVWEHKTAGIGAAATPVGTVYEVAQPYANHNAGQLAFGPDGMLYVGWGDGGSGGDPHGQGQNPGTALGAMLRLDVDRPAPHIPADNPGKPGWLPEIWAIGLRNPWRYSFDDKGRLVVADVGQNAWEEVGYVTAGGNAGWKLREGRHDFDAGGAREGLLEPFWQYPHSDGQSVTGGYVYGGRNAALKGQYVFADYASGRMWALTLPDVGGTVKDVTALGTVPFRIATFGRAADGTVYVGDHGGGHVYRLD